MRLTDKQIQAIRQLAQQVAGAGARVSSLRSAADAMLAEIERRGWAE
jgi:hypothetical protein